MAKPLILRPTTLTDLDFVMSAERHPDNAPYIGQWSRVRHEAAIASSEQAHFVAIAQTHPVGYVILIDIDSPDRSVGLKRIVMTEKGLGYGRQALRQVKAIAFEQFGCHRLWLDVLDSNHRAKALYKSEGFVTEGLLRESYKTATGYASQLLMSILDSEYFI